jgi:hypothetical protein
LGSKFLDWEQGRKFLGTHTHTRESRWCLPTCMQKNHKKKKKHVKKTIKNISKRDRQA